MLLVKCNQLFLHVAVLYQILHLGNHKAVQSTKGKGKGKVATKTKKPPSKRKIAVDDAENKLDLHTPLQDRTNVLDILSKAKVYLHAL